MMKKSGSPALHLESAGIGPRNISNRRTTTSISRQRIEKNGGNELLDVLESDSLKGLRSTVR